jgi:hypothetical protein
LVEIQKRTVSWLRLSDDVQGQCKASDDALDAVVAALIARTVAVGQCEPIPEEARLRARREGWIALPTPTSLDSIFELRPLSVQQGRLADERVPQ